MREEFKQSVRQFIYAKDTDRFLQNDIDWHDNYIEAGYIDSLGIYELIEHLESELGVEIAIEHFLQNLPRSFYDLHNLIYGQD
jgi:acyl carrier protein